MIARQKKKKKKGYFKLLTNKNFHAKTLDTID